MNVVENNPKHITCQGHSSGHNHLAKMHPLHNLIAQRAYEIWEKRGRLDGYADQDWAEAERICADEIIERHDLSTPNSQLCCKSKCKDKKVN